MIAALVLAAAVQHWLVVNDIHLNPFTHAGIVRGEDTSPILWHRTLHEMRIAVPHPAVIVLGGDMLAHHFPDLAREAHVHVEDAVLQTDRSIAQDLNAAYPQAQALVALGNNDDPCGDYRSETNGTFEQDLARIWEPLVNRRGAAPDFLAQFDRGGYYTARLPVRSGEAIVLNSVFWSIVYSGGCLSHPKNPGGAELSWLQSELSGLPAGANAVLVMHIPPGYDPEATLATRRLLAFPFLNGGANRSFIDTVRNHQRVIREIIGAHTHRYDFRVVGEVPMLIASSVSPVYNNNPAFYDVTVDANGSIDDVVPYAYHLLDGQFVREPSFRTMYAIPAFSTAQLEGVAARIQSDASTRDIWKRAYGVWSWRVGDLDIHWLPFACAHTELGGGFASCAHISHRTEAAEIAAGLVVAAIVIGVGGLIVVRRRAANARR